MSSQRQTSQHSRQETFSNLPSEYLEKSSSLPDKIDTQAVVDLIRNADLFDLINISLNAKDLRTEQVEQFIQRALDKGTSQHKSHAHRAQVLDPKQLELIFTPPSKISKQHQQSCCSPSRIEMSNDENVNIIIDSDFKQSAGRQQFREWLQAQQPLQPSIIENSSAPSQCQQALQSIQYSLQNQITNSKQQMFEELQKQIKHKLQLNESQDMSSQQPRDQVPRPYSEQTVSPDTTNQYRHYHNQSFSDQDFVQESVQSQLVEAQKLRNNQEMPFKGDFSFHLTGIHESFLKKSEVSSSYSTLQDGTQASSEKERQSTEESLLSSKNYEAAHHYHIQANAKRTVPEDNQKFLMNQILMSKTNNRAQQQDQQSSTKKSLNRSTSNNKLQKSAERTRNVNLNSTQSTKNVMLRSFINTSRNQDQLSKTPRGAINLCQIGQLTSRNQDSQQKERHSSILKALNDQKKCLDHRKQLVLNQLQLMNIKYLIEVERIKKPSQLAYITARLICQFFNIFRDQQYQTTQNQRQSTLHMEDLIEWVEIQKHINTQIIKQMNELLSSIKLKILSHETLNPQVKDSIALRLIQLRQEYFTGDNLKLFKHLNTNKSLQVIINFVYNVMKYFLESQLAEHESNDAFNQTDCFRSFIESERSQNLNESQTVTPVQANFQISSAQKTPRLGAKVNLEKSPLHEKKLQKSASRCLLQRRERSAILGVATARNNKPDIYQSNQCATPRLGQTMTLQEAGSATRQPFISRHKSKSPLVRNGHRKNEEVSQSITSEQFKQKISTNHRQRFTPQLGMASDHSVSILEKPLQLNYKLMIQSSGFNEAIKKNAADIESNMSSTPQRKQIDMNIIEQLKLRRIEQRQRDASEDRSCERLNDL